MSGQSAGVNYNIVMERNDCTVVAEYVPEHSRVGEYQSEAELEAAFIRQLETLGYEYLNIHKEDDLVRNLRTQLERLNDYSFSDKEWERFFNSSIANGNNGIAEKTKIIQEDYVQLLRRDNGEGKNIRLIDKAHIHNNVLQVINQYEEDKGRHDTRYDVTILVNGLPLVHVELKRRGVAIKEAFNQINRYQRDSFWAGSGLFEFVQLFVISNGTNTKYYSNTTRERHIKESGKASSRTKKTSNSFEFTSYWADALSKTIPDLTDFTKTFFSKHTLLNVLTKYCVFTSDGDLLVMRPYQIAAAERILNRITVSSNYKTWGKTEAGGYIWHTTGSGKTLTSFKTAQLATGLSDVDKVLFVVDRKDLDYQTVKEYDRFEKGAANSNKSTAVLQKQLEDPQAKIIVTTIQKLATFISKNAQHEVYNKHVVMIFDECHRSQFGKMHRDITKKFKKYHIFGFTGTPIFAENASKANPDLTTTQQAFGDKLHSYTIVNAISDENVLPFRIDYINTFKEKEDVRDSEVSAIDVKKALANPQRISEIVSYVLEHFDQKTKRGQSYLLKDRRTTGFNSIFACDSIPSAMRYYEEFKKQLAKQNRNLKIAAIYSYGVNEDDLEGFIDDEDFDTGSLDKTSRDFLDYAINDYNKTFSTNFDTGSTFENYYKDVSQRMKNKELDILIVVNMFLTGFDATTLNTLWVDKNLKQHGLIQAFSRTNRILNSVKTFGNIVCFRNLEEETNNAIALFGDKDASGIVLLKSYEDYYNGYNDEKGHHAGYAELVEAIMNIYPLGVEITGEKNEKEFISLFNLILKLRNILQSFDRFAGEEILSPREFQDYRSLYLDLYEKWRPVRKDAKEDISDDVVFEIELIKQIEVNIDYILMLVKKYHEKNCEDKEIVAEIVRAIDSSTQLRSKKELILNFLDRINVNSKVEDDWRKFVLAQKESDLDEIIAAENLKPEETKRFVDKCLHNGALRTTGTEIMEILPPVSLFSRQGNKGEKKRSVIEKLTAFFEKYLGLGLFEE